MFDSVCGLKVGEPLFERSEFLEDVVVDVYLKTEYFALLELRLGSGVTAPALAVFPAECQTWYLKGEA